MKGPLTILDRLGAWWRDGEINRFWWCIIVAIPILTAVGYGQLTYFYKYWLFRSIFYVSFISILIGGLTCAIAIVAAVFINISSKSSLREWRTFLLASSFTLLVGIVDTRSINDFAVIENAEHLADYPPPPKPKKCEEDSESSN